jgi:TolA-binding protein
MMLSCRRARALLVENVRGSVPQSALVQLDLHLADCAACRRERARVSTLSTLRQWAPVGLGAPARARIVAKLASVRVAGEARGERRRRAWPWALALTSAATAAALVIAVAAHRRHLGAPTVAAYDWTTPGSVRLLDAELRYGAGTRVEVDAGSRTIALSHGELDVTEHGAPVRVRLVRAVVVVSGHATFAGEQIRVWSGETVVFDSDMHEVATLGAGQRWPTAPAAPPAPAPPSAPAPAAAAAVPQPHAASADDTQRALDRARTALADGDTASARRWARRAFDDAAAPRHRAEAELFLAESYLVDQRPDRAITLYREVALTFPHTAEGEAAAFAAGQVLYERGRVDEARATLRAYVARYPDGRFAREATDRLSALAE